MSRSGDGTVSRVDYLPNSDKMASRNSTSLWMRGTEGHEDDFPKKKRSKGRRGDLATTLRTCSEATRFSPSQEEEEGLPLPAPACPCLLGNGPHARVLFASSPLGPRLLPSENPVPCDREVARWERGGAPGDQLAAAGGDGGGRPARPVAYRDVYGPSESLHSRPPTS